VDVDAVQERAGEPRQIQGHLLGRAQAGLARVAQVAAGAFLRCLSVVPPSK
jgi:hypothetical protein